MWIDPSAPPMYLAYGRWPAGPRTSVRAFTQCTPVTGVVAVEREHAARVRRIRRRRRGGAHSARLGLSWSSTSWLRCRWTWKLSSVRRSYCSTTIPRLVPTHPVKMREPRAMERGSPKYDHAPACTIWSAAAAVGAGLRQSPVSWARRMPCRRTARQRQSDSSDAAAAAVIHRGAGGTWAPNRRSAGRPARSRTARRSGGLSSRAGGR